MTVISEIKVPKEDADEEVYVNTLHYNNKDKIKKSAGVLDIETSKAVLELEASLEGFIEYLVEVGEVVEIGQTVALIHDSLDSFEGNKDQVVQERIKREDFNEEIKITKGAQELIDKHKLDTSSFKNSFIKKEDVERFLKESKSIAKEDGVKVAYVSKALSRSKVFEIEALSHVQSTGLVSTIFMNFKNKVIDNEDNLLAKSASASLPLLTLHTSQLLKEFPLFNSYFFENEIREYSSINIGIAFDIDDGLKVFSIPNTDQLPLEEINNLLSEGVYKYIRKELSPKDISNSTFTITDLSQYKVESFVPLINKNQSAILGVSSLDTELNRFNVSLSFDHRVTEGKQASIFLGKLRKLFEED